VIFIFAYIFSDHSLVIISFLQTTIWHTLAKYNFICLLFKAALGAETVKKPSYKGFEMNIRFKKFSSAIAIGLALSVPLIQGCASTSNDTRATAAVEDKQFNAWFDNLVNQIKADPKYKRMPLDTKVQQNEFLVWLHDAYRKKTSKQALTQKINSAYPGHAYEASFIASKLP